MRPGASHRERRPRSRASTPGVDSPVILMKYGPAGEPRRATIRNRIAWLGGRALLLVVDRLAVVPLVDVHDPVPVEAGNVALARVEHVGDAEPLGMIVVEHRVYEADVVPRLRPVPQEGPGVAAVPAL